MVGDRAEAMLEAMDEAGHEGKFRRMEMTTGGVCGRIRLTRRSCGSLRRAKNRTRTSRLLPGGGVSAAGCSMSGAGKPG